MKNFNLKKFLVILTTFIVVISLFSVICSADASNGVFVPGDSITFNEYLTGEFIPDFIEGPLYFIDGSGSRVYISMIEFQYRGYVVMDYVLDSGSTVTVYSDGWTDDIYRTIYFDTSVVLSGNALAFVSLNASDSGSNYYESIYNIIVENVYGSVELTEDMRLSVSLISTLLSIGAILLPIIVGVSIFIWILKRF